MGELIQLDIVTLSYYTSLDVLRLLGDQRAKAVLRIHMSGHTILPSSFNEPRLDSRIGGAWIDRCRRGAQRLGKTANHCCAAA